MFLLRTLLFTFSLSMISLAVNAQQKLLSPNEFLPHQLGEYFIQHHLIVDYFEDLADNSDQLILKEYGRTNQSRPLVLAYISSKKNLANLEQIRQNNLIRTGLLKGEIKEEQPIAIVWLGFGVHGNEAGATNSAVATVYELLNPENKNIQEWLENTVVILDPCLNPDGYSRYVHWNRNAGNKVPNPHVESREHREPWPSGRVNHYLFDLNRDWAWATQKETQYRIKEYNEWMPHINVDVHEQGYNDPYYFAPAAQPYHQYITQWQGDFQTEIGLNHTKYFDKEGWLYFTREIFDLFYPSYGDTYPTFHGAIGMTYEQAGHSLAGRSILIENGDTLTLMDRILHHKTTALSTVEISSKHADRLVKNFEKYYDDSNNGRIGKYKTYIIKGTNSRAKRKALIDFLDEHKIAYGNAAAVNKSIRAFSYQTAKETNIILDKKDLMISTYQPLSVLTQVLFEPHSELVDSLTYDITAWSLPYAHGLEAYATTQKMKVSEDYQLEAYTELKEKSTPYAYIADWTSLNSAQFLSALHQEEIVVRAATEPFTMEGKEYAEGTLIVLRIDNMKSQGADFDTKIRRLARTMEQDLTFAKTGFVTKGHDFGSAAVKVLPTPKVLLVSGDDLDQNAFGQVWHYFEEVLDMQLAVVDAEALGSIHLDHYNTIIMPDGRYEHLNTSATEELQEWLKAGGKLIALGGAIAKLRNKKGFALTRKSGEIPPPRRPAVGCYAAQERNSISNNMPGAVYKLEVDNTHPLGFGLPSYYFTLKTSSVAYEYLDKGWNVAYAKKDPMILGFVGANVQGNLEESLSYGVQEIGRGKVVYMIDNPLYRGFWRQGLFLFSNAVFMVD